MKGKSVNVRFKPDSKCWVLRPSPPVGKRQDGRYCGRQLREDLNGNDLLWLGRQAGNARGGNRQQVKPLLSGCPALHRFMLFQQGQNPRTVFCGFLWLLISSKISISLICLDHHSFNINVIGWLKGGKCSGHCIELFLQGYCTLVFKERGHLEDYLVVLPSMANENILNFKF
jgi:hypothetical protein